MNDVSDTNEVKTRSFTIRLTPEDQAALAEGGQLSNPTAYVQRLNRVLIRLSGASV